MSHPLDLSHEWPYRCTSCSVMHAYEDGEDKRYYQNQRGQECCKICPYNTEIVGSIAAAVPDTIRKCVCKRGYFTQYIDFDSVRMRMWDPGLERYTGKFDYPIPMGGYPCESCHDPRFVMTYTPEMKGMYCAEPTINGVVQVINK